VNKIEKDKLVLFQEALNLTSKSPSEAAPDPEGLTPAEMVKFTRLLKMMVWLDMDSSDHRVLH